MFIIVKNWQPTVKIPYNNFIIPVRNIIDFDSTEGQGTTFWFTLQKDNDLEITDVQETIVEAQTTEFTESPNYKKLLIELKKNRSKYDCGKPNLSKQLIILMRLGLKKILSKRNEIKCTK